MSLRGFRYSTTRPMYKMDKRAGFAIALLFCIAAEARLAPNLQNGTSLPVTYPAKILEGGKQVCPTQDLLEMARMGLKKGVQALIQNISTPGSNQSTESGRKYTDCKNAYERGETENGVYTVTPDDGPPFDVYCNMEIDNGGWTVFQRRQDGSQDFYLYWDDYENGFGDLNGEFWLGLSNIHRLTAAVPRTELRIDLEDFDEATVYAKYNVFAVGDSNSNYVLTVSGYSGTAGDSLSQGIDHNGQPFSTRDRDNDATSTHCAVTYKGAWWYRNCHYSNLNGIYHGGDHSSFADGVNWNTWRGYYYSLKFTEMKLRRV